MASCDLITERLTPPEPAGIIAADCLSPEEAARGTRPRFERALRVVSVSACVLYFVALLPVFFLPVFVTDEVKFSGYAEAVRAIIDREGWLRFLSGQENRLGYGALYWILLTIVAKLSASPLTVLRGMALIELLTVPAALWLFDRGERRRETLYATLLWLTFPMAWWTGKLVGPELLSIALLMVGTVLLSRTGRGTWFAGAALLGIAVGVKLTNAPVILIAATLAASRGQLLRRAAWPWLVSGSVVGGILSNPFVLVHPQHFFLAYERIGGAPQFNATFLSRVMSNDFWHWDGVFDGGWYDWGIAAWLWPVFILVLWFGRVRGSTLMALIVAVAACLAMFMSKGKYFGWYWLPLLAFLPLVLRETLLTRRWQHAAICGLIVVNGLANAPLIAEQYRMKLEHFAAYSHVEAMQREVNRAAERCEVDTVVLLPDTEVVLDVSAFHPHHPGQPIDVKDVEWFWHLPNGQAREQFMPVGSRTVCIHSNRLRRLAPMFVPERDIPHWTGQFEVREERGSYLTFLWIERKS